MLRILFYLLGCWMLLAAHQINAAVFSCKTAEGKTTFTDNPQKCAQQPTRELKVKIPKQTRVNYRYPERIYVRTKSAWPIFIEKPESPADQPLYDRAITRLEQTLTKTFLKFPQQSHAKLKTVSFYIMRGPKHSLGGEEAVLRYAAHNSTSQYSLHDKRWDNAVIIYNLDNYLYQDQLWNDATMVHELAHAWHFLQWTYGYQPIIDAWLNSRNAGLYQSVPDRQGKMLNPAYASTNEREYFADLSAIYFAGGHYFPFNKKGLANYDPKGYAMIEAYWFIKSP